MCSALYGFQSFREHHRFITLLLQLVGCIAVFMFFIFPAYLKFNPAIMTELAFLNRITWPPYIDMTVPSDFRLNSTRYFRLDSTDSVSLGVWHILPVELHDSTLQRTDDDYENTFRSGYPIFVYYHGNAGTRAANHRVQLYKRLSRNGYHVVTFDYRGYADSTGKPSEQGLMEDALTVYNYVRKHSASSPVYIWGHSMGSGVATKTAKYLCDHDQAPDAVILESPFTNLLEACVRHPFTAPFRIMPWFSWVFVEGLKQNNIYFYSDRSIGDITVPTLILHAKDDAIVPYELGHKLYEIALHTKTKGRLKFIDFESELNYGHKHIHKAPELPQMISDFLSGQH